MFILGSATWNRLGLLCAVILLVTNGSQANSIAKRSAPIEQGGSDLQQFTSQLSAEDQLLLKKLGARVKFLENELQAGPHQPNRGEESAGPLKKSTIRVDTDPEVQDFVDHLSPEDQLVLQKLQSRIKFLKAALHETVDAPNPGEEVKVMAPAKRSQTATETAGDEDTGEEQTKPDNDSGEKQESEFTAADRVLLKNVATKLDDLRQALAAFKEAQGRSSSQSGQSAQVAVLLPAQLLSDSQMAGAQTAESKPAGDGQPAGGSDTEEGAKKDDVKKSEDEGNFGDFVDGGKSREEREFYSGWHETPALENELGIVGTKCPEGRELECKDSVERRRSMGGSSDDDKKVNLRELIQALRTIQNSDKQNVAETEHDDLQ